LFSLINQSALHIGCFAFCSVFKGLLRCYQQLIYHITCSIPCQQKLLSFFQVIDLMIDISFYLMQLC
ncbi:hypothetical protein, partial [Enterococcus sp. 2201sp1_2201st1_B8_2201SCRN_220225]|uniref:hypothetical protein n=1 Tax=Enterococcus sp. 2201sp1_2201st1_B8_2201SCRN_220225 TaxID=3141592 RepID=UPI0034A1311B